MGSIKSSKAKREQLGKVATSLNNKLKNVEWGKFRIGDLFQVGTGSLLSSTELSMNGDIPRISAKSDNNGVLNYLDSESLNNARHFNNFISVNFFGSDGGIFYHPYKASVEMKVHTLKIPKIELNQRTGIFLCSALYKALHGFGYGDQLSSSKLRDLNLKIQLPIQNGEPDFAFMESFIAELEMDRISELETYLSVTGLSDYELTKEEKLALEEYDSLTFKDFNITDIFNIKNTKSILSRDICPNSGAIPYLCASADNNAISSYISYDKKLLDTGNCIFIGGKTFVVTYQECDFFSNDSHNLTLTLKNEDYRLKLSQIYLSTCVRKSLNHKYSWGDSISNNKIQKDKIRLPLTNNTVDYLKMKIFISAIQKLVIKDVVLYTDKKHFLIKK
jgi:hypothetical protein